MKIALITGVTGQDGSYLAEILLEKGYKVHGMKRRTSLINTERINHIFSHENFTLHYGDITDGSCLHRLINEIQPNEVYNLAAMSHVKVSFEIPEYTAETVAIGTLRLLEAIKGKPIKLYQASSSEMYGKVLQVPQSETTPFYPRSPYAVAKVFAHQMCVNYREAYDMFICNGILFNHESPRRGETFVTQKITTAAVRIAKGLQEKLYLGNLEAQRDWGHAKDYMYAAYLMMQHRYPDDYVISTGVTASVKDFCILAFREVGIDLHFKYNQGWSGTRVLVEVDDKYFRPTEVDLLVGDSSKAREILGWAPTYTLKELIKEMINNENIHHTPQP